MAKELPPEPEWRGVSGLRIVVPHGRPDVMLVEIETLYGPVRLSMPRSIALKVGRSIAEEAEKLAPDRVTFIADAGNAPPPTPGSPLGESGPRGHGARQLIDLASSLESLGRFGSVIWASVWTCDQLEYGKVGVFHPIL